MGEKYNKPLIIITAALSIAVITLSVQVVLLTFSVKDQKDTVRQLLTRTNTAYAVENRYTELNGSLQQLRREAEGIKNDTISLSAEINSLRDIISKINTDAQFMQIELNDVSARLMHLEKARNTTSTAAQSISASASIPKSITNSDPKTEGSLETTLPTSGSLAFEQTHLSEQASTSVQPGSSNSTVANDQANSQEPAMSAESASPVDSAPGELNTVYPTHQLDENDAYFEGSEPPTSMTVTSIPATNVSLSPEDALQLEGSKK